MRVGNQALNITSNIDIHSFRGIIAYFRVRNGVIRKGDKIKFFNTGKSYKAEEVGILKINLYVIVAVLNIVTVKNLYLLEIYVEIIINNGGIICRHSNELAKQGVLISFAKQTIIGSCQAIHQIRGCGILPGSQNGL